MTFEPGRGDEAPEDDGRRTPEAWIGLGVSVAFSILWIGLAIGRPDTTFHLAPLIIAGAPPIAIRSSTSRRRALNLSVAGTLLALLVTLLLEAFDALRGPSVLPFGGALEESIVFAVVGGLFAVAFALSAGR